MGAHGEAVTLLQSVNPDFWEGAALEGEGWLQRRQSPCTPRFPGTSRNLQCELLQTKTKIVALGF